MFGKSLANLFLFVQNLCSYLCKYLQYLRSYLFLFVFLFVFLFCISKFVFLFEQFIYVALLCWTANNAMILFFKVYVGQWLTQVIFYSVLESEYRLISFKTWICLLNICFLFCDGVCSTPPNVFLMIF